MLQRSIGFLTVFLVLAAPALHAQEKPDYQAVMQALTRAKTLWQEGNYAEAMKQSEKALSLMESAFGPDELITAGILNPLAELHQRMGQYDKAESLYRRSLKIQEARQGPEHPDVAKVMENLADLYQQIGQYGKAEQLFQGGLKIKEKAHGKNHPAVADSLRKLAKLSKEAGQPARADALWRRVIQIEEANLGNDRPEDLPRLKNLAAVHKELELRDKAETFYLRCLKILEAQANPDRLELAHVLNRLAEIHGEKTDLPRAETFYKRGLKILESELGPDHPEVAGVALELGFLYLTHSLRSGKWEMTAEESARAEAYLQRAVRIIEAKYSPEHPAIARAEMTLAWVYTLAHRSDEMLQAVDRARRIVRRHGSQVLPALSEAEQLLYLQNVEQRSFGEALSLGMLLDKDPVTVAFSAGWVLNGKGVAQQALAENILFSRDSADPKIARIVQELQGMRRQLATMSFNSAGQDSKPQEHEKLAEKYAELSKQLGQARARLDRSQPWIELTDVRQAIPGDGVLIEIARFRNLLPGKDEPPSCYAAWIIPARRQGVVRLVNLGDADKIDAAVLAARQALKAAPQNIRRHGEPESEAALRQTLDALSKLVLDPLLPHIGSKNHWIFCPDGSLWLVPWAALLLPKTAEVSKTSAVVEYAIEKHRISYAISGRDLVRAAAQFKTNRPVVMADPDFDLEPAEARSTARQLLEATTTRAATRGFASHRLPQVARLPGTAAEAESIKPSLERYSKEEVVDHRGKHALEGVFKSVRGPRVLVLSTHGFFLEDQELTDPNPPSGRREPAEKIVRAAPAKSGKPLENPLLRCGILLAGCNQREAKLGPNDEDGVLTGLEIVGTDLRGTELVVLSACETGLGQVRNGEGVAGLRQAFQLAGARAVIATLWQIPDRDSALLMSAFFENLAAGKNKADALREAQLTRIKARRERHGAAHPFFWAAFTLTGE